ncbi:MULTISPECIES: MFS transporter [unclassified Methylophaga]|uniref:MFS transporter n=1 Tax=unclassified Methylophaga TaxID=2629249 RepID=UPI000C89802A|nr:MULTISPECIES: MFS transporter [unclassified Methylophaga]MBN46684.1 MFS transporter [Methylophaga sp.]
MPFSALPYWRLSGFYLFYFATLGILVPYWGLYLQWEGFSARQIGELTAILLATRIIAPNVWGWIADHRGQRMRIVRLASFLSILAFSAIFISQSYYWIAAVLMLFSFFWNASLPQFEVTTLQHLGEYSHHYSKIRVWGSIGFICVVVLLGWLLDRYDAGIVPYALLVSISGIWLISLTVPELASRHLSLNHIPIKQLLKQPAVRAFLAICFLMLVSHGPYYTFYSIYLEQHGYSRTLIGQLWALGVVAELMVFLVMHRWLPRFGIRKVLLASLLLAALRWLLIALYADQIFILIAAQSLHAASYGAYHAASIAWLHQHFTGRNQGRGQALYSSMSFGAGGAVGSLLSGYLWITPGPEMTFILAALTACTAFLIGFVWLKTAKSIAGK